AGKHFKSLVEAGKDVRPARGETLSSARLVSIERDAKNFRNVLGSHSFDGKEPTAAKLAKEWRDTCTDLLHSQKIAAGTFNDRIKFIRMFLGWLETSYL